MASVFLLVGCSGGDGDESAAASSTTPFSVAETMIDGELADDIGLGPLTSSCDDPGLLAVGVTFGCVATTETGVAIGVQGLVNDEGRIQLTTTNLITAQALASYERDAAAALNDTVGSNFTAESVDCGSTPIVLPPELVMGCALVMPSSGEVYDLMLTVTDLDQRHFSLVVGDEPRPG